MHLILTSVSQKIDYYTNLLRALYLPSPYLPAASPGIFVGEEGRGMGGRGHDLERNMPPKFCFFICFRALAFANTQTTHFCSIKERKNEISVGGFDPYPVT